MTSRTLWSRELKEHRRRTFIGRQTELSYWDELLTKTQIAPVVAYYYGIPGVGKTYLLEVIHDLASKKGCKTAFVNERYADLADLIGGISSQLVKQGAASNKTTKVYQRLTEIKAELNADPTVSDLVAKSTGTIFAKSVTILSASFNPLGSVLELLGGEQQIAGDVAQLVSYVRSKYRNKYDRELISSPIKHLTEALAADINSTAWNNVVLLLFDSYEYLYRIVENWLIDDLLPAFDSTRIILCVASRSRMSSRWTPIRTIVREHKLEIFTAEEITAYLSTMGQQLPQQDVERLQRESHRLPALVSLLALQSSPNPTEATEDAVIRLLKWVPEDPPWLRNTLIASALPRTVDLDTLQQLGAATHEDAYLIQKIITELSPIELDARSWVYSAVVRDVLIEHLRNTSPITFRKTHETLVQFNERQVDELGKLKTQTLDSVMQRYQLEVLYHKLCIGRGLDEFCRDLMGSIRSPNGLRLISEMLEAANRDGILPGCYDTWSKHLLAVFDPNPETNHWQWMKLLRSLEPLLSHEDHTTQAVLYYQMAYHEYMLGSYMSALTYGRLAIEIRSDYVSAFNIVGLNLHALGERRQAEEMFWKAIRMRPDYLASYGNLAKLYLDEGRLADARLTYEGALHQAHDSVFLYNLGTVLLSLEDYTAAQSYFQDALDNGWDNISVFQNLAITLYRQGEISESLVNFLRVLEIDPTNKAALTAVATLHEDPEVRRNAVELFLALI